MTKIFKPDLEIMATFRLEYEGMALKVNLLQGTHGSPEFFFHVQLPDLEYFISKTLANGELWWLGNQGFEKDKKLGEAIEQFIGYTLPPRETNDPFEYQGDRTVRVESFQIGGMLIERARAPFNSDVYFRLHLSKRERLTIVKMAGIIFSPEGAWVLNDDVLLKPEAFEVFKNLLKNFEKAYQLKIYKPFRVLEK